MARREEENEEVGTEYEFTLKPAKREGIKALVLLFGHSGSGKTYSAFRLARGLVGPDGRIGILDTEHLRAKHYADEFEFEHAPMAAPYTPARYLKALREFEKQGVDCMIVDSMSHVQEGEGGLIDMAAEEERKAGGNTGMGSQWAKPKAEWKRVRNAFLQSKMHIIFCARAKNPLEKESEGSRKLVRGDLVPIMPRDFEYEVTISLGIELETHAIVPIKLPNQLAGAFPLDEYISEASGQMLSQWLNGEKIVDAAFEALKDVGREQAAKGLEPLKAWFTSLDGKNRTRLKEYLDDVLKPLALGQAPRQPAASGADSSRSETPARGGKKSAPPPPPPPPAAPPPPPKDAKKKQEDPPEPERGDPGAGHQDGLDFDDDGGGDDADRGGDDDGSDEGDGELPKHDYPPIRLGKDPNWSDIANEICDYIEGSPADVSLIERVYADHLKRMEKDHPRSHRMVMQVINKAKAS